MNNVTQLNWKEKAVLRRYQLKNLQKRLQETKRSRDNWKKKHGKVKSELESMRKENALLKKTENQPKHPIFQ